MKHIHYHIHHYDLNRTPPVPNDYLRREGSCKTADFTNGTPEWEGTSPTSFLSWHSKLPRSVSLSLFNSKLGGESVLWDGAPNPDFIHKSFKQRSLALAISLIVTLFFSTLPMDLEQAVIYWFFFGIWLICFDVWVSSRFLEVKLHKNDYYVITHTRVLFFHGAIFYSMQIKDIVFWNIKVSNEGESMENTIGTILLDDKISSEFYWHLYEIDTFRYVKHLLLSLLAKSSTLTLKTTSDIPRLSYCPQCGYHLEK
jgi:hypothetical protein